MTNLKDKVAIVTGGASGIGLGTVKAFVEKGAKVVIADINEAAGKQAEAELKKANHDVIFIKADTGVEEEVKNLVSEAVKTFGKLDVIVNNAGFGNLGFMHELTYEDYHEIVKVNQYGVFYGMKYAVQEFMKTGGGVIINTASILGLVGEAGAFPYAATKGAVIQMTKSAALQYADKNIRVNAIAPGYINSVQMSREKLGEFYDGLLAKTPIGRLGEAEDIGHAMVFLAENEFTTGAILSVDGGYTTI